MTISQIETQIRYVTNAVGKTTDVLIPLELWQKLINALYDNASGLACIDEQESKVQILTDLQESLREARTEQTFPVVELWDNIEA